MKKTNLWDNTSLQQDIQWDNQTLPGIDDETLLTKDWDKSDRMKQAYKDPEYRKKRSEIAKKIRESEEWKNRHKTAVSDEQYRKACSERNQRRWQDPEFRKRYLERMASDEVKKKIQEAAQKRELDPDYQKRRLEAAKIYSKDPERNGKISKKRREYFENNPEAKQELAERMRKQSQSRTKEQKKAMIDKRLKNGWRENVTKAAQKKWKPIMTPAGRFESKKQAVEHYGFDPAMIDYWRKKRPDEWYYIVEEIVEDEV